VTSPAALHSSDSSEHYTPAEVIAAARATMGGIDLDPFTTAKANTVVEASYYYTQKDDGFELPWGDTADPQRLFINPPCSKVKRKPARAPKALVKPAQIHGWWKLLDEYGAGHVEQAVFLCFNMNLFQTGQRFGYAAPFQFPLCVPSKRLKFWGEGRAPGEGSPSHASAIVYLPPRTRHGQPSQTAEVHGVELFRRAFTPLGEVRA
jgi:hypothetical protein